MNLQKWIAEHPMMLLERKSAKAIFCDAFEGNMAKVNLLLTAFDEDIVSSLKQVYPWSMAEKNRYIKILQEQHSIVKDKAIWTVETWASIFSQQLIHALTQLEGVKNAEEKIEKLNEMNQAPVEETKEPEYELGTRSDVDTFYVNPSLKEREDRIYVPCGIGNTDNGFFIYGC